MRNMTKGRVLEKAKTTPVSSDDFAELFCHKKTLQRNLAALHKEGELYIHSWITGSEPGPYLPRYMVGTKKDAPYPHVPTHAEKKRQYRLDPDVRNKHNGLKRLARIRARPKDISIAGMLMDKRIK